MAAPATYPGVLRARIRRCRVSAALPSVEERRAPCVGSAWTYIATSVRSRSLEDGVIRSAGQIATRLASLELFAQSLVSSDVVALEATTGADAIVSVLQARGIRVIVANTRKLRAITEAKAKTDRLDARTLARLLVSGLLDEVWTPDERTRSAAAADEPARADRAWPDAGEERGARRAGAQPLRASAGHRRLRQGRPSLAGAPRAAGRRAADARRLSAPGRLPGRRGRRARPRDRHAARWPGPRCCG